jgi:acyl carrier protein
MTEKTPAFDEPLADSDAVMRTIQECLNDLSKKSPLITRSTRIDRFFNDVFGGDSLDFLDLSFQLEAKLGVYLSADDWKFLSGEVFCKTTEEWDAKYGPLFTFGRLAELVAHRAKLGKARPVTILGSTSKSAGAFRQIQWLAQDISKSTKNFAPSTPIMDAVRGRDLRRLWARLRIVSDNRVPDLRHTLSTQVAIFFERPYQPLMCIAMLSTGVSFLVRYMSTGGFVAALIALVSGIGLIAIFLLMILLVLSFIIRMSSWAQPKTAILPNGVATFRDLAMLIAGERGGWCEHCGYDLTGLTSDRCPECGKRVKDRPSFASPKHAG